MGRPVKSERKSDPRVLVAANGRRAPEVTTDRRAQLVETAAEVFAQKGVGNTTMRDIADGAGILAGSLYHHFRSKDDLLEEVLRSALDELTVAYEKVERSELDAVSALEGLMLVGLRFVTEKEAVTSIVQNDYTYLHDMAAFSFVDDITAAHRKIWRRVLERGVREEVFRADLDLDIAYRSMMAAIVAEVRWRRGRARKPTAEVLAEKHSMFYLHGLVARANK
jgi:AcrR family transcriptional regulator